MVVVAVDVDVDVVVVVVLVGRRSFRFRCRSRCCCRCRWRCRFRCSRSDASVGSVCPREKGVAAATALELARMHPARVERKTYRSKEQRFFIHVNPLRPARAVHVCDP